MVANVWKVVYFARPDSCIDKISVHHSRLNMGTKLAKKMRATLGEEAIKEIDVSKWTLDYMRIQYSLCSSIC
jgi:glutamine phosphoribosylpyrophosphate amidotransferase